MVSIIWSITNGGDSLSGSNIDHANSSNGDHTDDVELFIRHNGDSSITNVGLYIREFSGNYTGGASATLDYNEIIHWGDETAEDDWGGLLVNLNATNNYPNASWPTYSSKSPSGGETFRTGYGDSMSNAILLPVTTGVSMAGLIATGSNPNVRFKCRIQVPTNEQEPGRRQLDQMLSYTFTS